MKEPFFLTVGDKGTPLWGRLLAHMEGRRNYLRVKNDNPLNEQETATLRGQIQELNALINLNKDKPLID